MTHSKQFLKLKKTSWLSCNLKSLVLLPICALLAACSTNLTGPSAPTATAPANQTSALASAPVQRQKPVKLALLLPLAGFGQSAIIAKSLKQSAEMALFERNQPDVELIVKDDKGTRDGAQAAATHAVAEGADLIIGPLLSQSVPGAALVARQANIPVIALSNDVSVAGNGVYLMSFLVQHEIDRIVSFAATRGKRQMAALIPDTTYGNLMETALRDAARRHGASVRILERHPVSANGMLKPAQRIMAAIKRAETAGLPIDSLFVPGGQDTLPSLGPILTYAGIDSHNIQMLGTGAWDYPGVAREAAFVGGWYAGPDPTAWKSFSERFSKTFGHAPPRIASLAYDAVGFAETLVAQQTGPTPLTPAGITRLNGYFGIDGLVRLTPSGQPQRSLAILQVGKFATTIVDPAPSHVGPQTVSSLN